MMDCMGIYDGMGGRSSLSYPKIPKKQILYLAGGIILLIVLLFIAVSLAEVFEPQPVHVIFSNNPLDLAHQQNSFMTVRVFNPAPDAVQNAVVLVQPLSPESVIVFPSTHTIPSFGTDEFREYTFTVRPNPRGPVSSGSYTIKIFLVLGEQQYEHDAILQIKAVN